MLIASFALGLFALTFVFDDLLDRQDAGTVLTDDEREEAEGLVALAELLTLLRLRAARAAAHE